MDALEPGLSARVGDRLSELDPKLERLVTAYRAALAAVDQRK